MKKLIPPHPPLEKGGWGDLKTIFTPTLPTGRQASRGKKFIWDWGIRLTPNAIITPLQALPQPLRFYNDQKPSILPLPE
jgi:hypothetical protein